jgi:hypothetical protein
MAERIPTESMARGERRPVATYPYIGGKNRPFSTGGYTDTRGLGPDLPADFGTNGTYNSENIDNSVFGPGGFLLSATQTARRKDVSNINRSNYNKAQGPGSSSSRPKYPTNQRDEVREGAKVLSKVLGKRKERREGGTPKDNRK